MMTDSKTWRDDAVCRDTDPNVMQPEVATREEVAYALTLCAGCPVAVQCRQLAESQDSPYGIHAGRWYGQEPRHPEVVACQWCGTDMEPGPRGTREYCSGACRLRAFRAREALSA